MSELGKIRFELGFEIEYAGEEGKFETFNAIDLWHPGLKGFDFYNTVDGWMAEAMFSMASKMDDFQKIMDSVDVDEAREQVAKNGGRGKLDMLKTAMTHKDYRDFLSYIRKHLVGSTFARIADTSRSLNADAWENIVEKGGLNILLEVIGKYLDFFEDTQTVKPIKEKPSPALNGSGLSVTPA